MDRLIKFIKIPDPTLEEQRSIAQALSDVDALFAALNKTIATVLSDIDAEIAALEARRAKTQAIKQGMMQELLTGRTRLV